MVCTYPRIPHAYNSFQWYCDSHRTSPSKRYAKVSFDMAILQSVSFLGRPQCNGSRLGEKWPTNCPIGSWLLKVLSSVWKTIKLKRWSNIDIFTNRQNSCSIVGFRWVLTRKHQRMIRHLDTGTSAYLYLELRSPTDKLQRFLHKSFHHDPHYWFHLVEERTA